MVTTRTKHALATGNMTLAWQEWKRCPIANHTWPNWKVHWTAAFAKTSDINPMTAGESAFGANAMEEEEQARQIASSLDNLANASIQKNLTIDSLVATNAQLTQALADIQIVMVCMIPPGHPPLYSGTVLAWGPNPLPTTAPPAAPAPPVAGILSQRPSHWGVVKLNWNKVGYCWTHGFRVKDGHNSTMCSSHRTGHQPGSTRANIMGGSWYNEGYTGPQRAPPPPTAHLTVQSSGRVYC